MLHRLKPPCQSPGCPANVLTLGLNPPLKTGTDSLMMNKTLTAKTHPAPQLKLRL
jgi:hypothetical protein